MKKTLFAAVLAAALPFAAHAADPISYTWIEGDYVNTEDADGFGVRGSLNFGESNFYGFAGYDALDVDSDVNLPVEGLDLDISELGFGYHHALSDRMHLLGELAWQNIDTGLGDLDGYRASIGLRGQLTDRLEGLVKANYYDIDVAGDDTTATAGLQFRFNPTWGVVGEVEFDGGDQVYALGVRASF